MIPCDWIEFAHLSIDEEDNKIAACWLFEGSLSHQFTFIENDSDNTKQ